MGGVPLDTVDTVCIDLVIGIDCDTEGSEVAANCGLEGSVVEGGCDVKAARNTDSIKNLGADGAVIKDEWLGVCGVEE